MNADYLMANKEVEKENTNSFNLSYIFSSDTFAMPMQKQNIHTQHSSGLNNASEILEKKKK